MTLGGKARRSACFVAALSRAAVPAATFDF
jgi:hypothetical protein